MNVACPAGTVLYPWKPYATRVTARRSGFAGILPELSGQDPAIRLEERQGLRFEEFGKALNRKETHWSG
jgi:hypothetical protein